MPVMLNLSNGRMLPESELEALRNVARGNPVSYTHLTLPTTPYV